MNGASETAVSRIHRLGHLLPGLGLAATTSYSSTLREGLREQTREANHLNEAAALGVSQDDARMILDRERAPAVERALTTPFPLDRDALWQRVHEQLLRHAMGEPYEPFPGQADYLRRLIGQLSIEEQSPMSIPDRDNATALAPQPGAISLAPAGTDPRDDSAFTFLDEATYAAALPGRMADIAEGLTRDWLGDFAGLRFEYIAVDTPDAVASAAVEASNRAAQANRDARLAQAHRYAWSGPTRYERMIARGFGLTIDQVFPKKPSVLDARHHRRYRNRQGRR